MSFIVVTAIGLACGVFIYLAFVKIPVKVKGMEKTEEIQESLGGLNCGACGYPGCFGFAQALTINPELIKERCCPFILQEEEKLTGLGASLSCTLDPAAMRMRAVLKCAGKPDILFSYSGPQTCKAATQNFGGYKTCPYSCQGLGDCIKVCPVDAIYIDTDRMAAVVDEEKCSGCGLCVKTCPNNIIELVPLETDINFKCNYRQLRDIPDRVKCDYGHDYCRPNCPASVDIPRYVRYISLGKPDEALAVIREKIPFPSVCGLVCIHPCETRCRRGRLDEPIAIRMLKRYAFEHDNGLWKQNSKKALPTGKKVAVVGSGPAGLTAAYYLAKLGHSVTAFEALPEPGGMTRVAIPDYRLPKDILSAEIEEITQAGVEIRTNTRIDSLEQLTNEGYDAIFLAIGAQEASRLGVPGDDSARVISCLDFLKDINLGNKVQIGDKVAVIGGGNTAMDSARTALRLGAKEVVMFYRRTRAEMPANPEEIEDALAEGIQINYLMAPTEIITNIGSVSLECTYMKLGALDASGRRRPVPIKDSKWTADFDTIIAAIGQRPENPGKYDIATGRGDVITVNADTMATSLVGVYAGGDVVSGPASVIEAIAHGRKAATAIDNFLGGKGEIDESLAPLENTVAVSDDPEKKPQLEMPTIPVEQRISSFEQVELGYPEKIAMEEASRCFRCDLDCEIKKDSSEEIAA
jgi:NADPH-dependent glutamate synthase beta subunit-like oxidoreductase/Na+-translocating ferredoxin:NAD+ oxidoreductase RNF subunit RnfB